jgi:hypothetical protein
VSFLARLRPVADRSLVRAFAWGFFSLREAASGCAPDRAVTFFRFPERKSPKKGGPDGGGRPMADCSAVLGVWGLAPNSLRGPWPLRSDSRAKSVDEACCARGPKPLCSSTPPTGPKSNMGRCFATSHPRLASPRQGEAEPMEPMRSEPNLVFFSPFGRAEQRRALRGARQRASITDFGRLSERSERSERSEFGPTRKDRAAQGSPRTARAESAGVASLPPFLSIQERRSAAGTKPRRTRRQAEEATTRQRHELAA